MNFKEYQKLAQRTSNTKHREDKLANGLMGLNGEAGEAIDILKKYYYQGHELDKDKLRNELGDVLWYIAETCVGLGTTLEDIAKGNIDKLKKRYPEGFEADKSIHRKSN
ncbi:MAG: nucleoside triphosphate pyrophosphohydrolase family protein [Tissierella sp.]|nr:nucleoside triphosphate pyrophosphohydrolase family protein [Tissierella sp.]